MHAKRLCELASREWPHASVLLVLHTYMKGHTPHCKRQHDSVYFLARLWRAVKPMLPELLAPGRQRPGRAGSWVAVHLPEVALTCRAVWKSSQAYVHTEVRQHWAYVTNELGLHLDCLHSTRAASPASYHTEPNMEPEWKASGFACSRGASARHLALHKRDSLVAVEELMCNAQANDACITCSLLLYLATISSAVLRTSQQAI